MRSRDQETLIKATDSHRLVRQPDVWDELLPIVPTAPTYRLRTVWRIESKGKCQECGEFRCTSTCALEEDGEGYLNWQLEAKITVTEPRGPAWPLRVEMQFGERGLSSTNDPQTMIWLGELLTEVGRESAGAFEIPIVAPDGSGVGVIADEVAS